MQKQGRFKINELSTPLKKIAEQEADFQENRGKEKRKKKEMQN
jgi:hypothetical protein